MDDISPKKGAKHSSKAQQKSLGSASAKKTDNFESQYKRYKINTLIKPIGLDSSLNYLISDPQNSVKGLSKFIFLYPI